jgi:hypothetical protein
MKNQPASEECAFTVQAAVEISYAVPFGSRQFIHKPPLLYFNGIEATPPKKAFA